MKYCVCGHRSEDHKSQPEYAWKMPHDADCKFCLCAKYEPESDTDKAWRLRREDAKRRDTREERGRDDEWKSLRHLIGNPNK